MFIFTSLLTKKKIVGNKCISTPLCLLMSAVLLNLTATKYATPDTLDVKTIYYHFNQF